VTFSGAGHFLGVTIAVAFVVKSEFILFNICENGLLQLSINDINVL
jgi:hypothetical protein